jgi:REP element-mobilizing transposase RayT
MERDVPGLRNFKRAQVLRRAFVKACVKPGFRICQFSIQGNHVHLVCEASDRVALASGIQGWAVRVARGINRAVGRKGKLFFDRYYVTVIKTPSQMRNTLCYVLQNARRHGAALDRRWHGVDPFSSAWWFDGWDDNERWRLGLVPADEPPVAPAKGWLLTTGWRRRGLIGVTEVPPAARP